MCVSVSVSVCVTPALIAVVLSQALFVLYYMCL